MPKLTLAEHLAQDRKIVHLAEIAERSVWDLRLVEQAVLVIGAARPTWTCNELRDVLPEQGRGFLGAAISGLRVGGLIAHTGRMVPSTSTATKGHRISEWTLTATGRALAEHRTSTEQVAA